jgi:hypothetical protein
MPVHKQGKGFQWGNHCKVYTGPEAKSKAAAQGRAAYANGYRGKSVPRKPRGRG